MTVVGAIAVPHPPLIVPAVGRGDEKRIQATIDAYARAADELLQQAPDCLVVTSPHAPLFRDAFHITTDEALEGDMARFRAPHTRIRATCDVKLAREIEKRANAAGILAIGSDRYRDDMDHGTYVPLHFVREAYRSRHPEASDDLPCPIVRIGLSGLSPETHRALGKVIAEAAEALGRSIGFIASGDLSHKLLEEGPYGFAPEGPVFDEQIGEIFARGNLEQLFEFEESFCEAAAECGLRSFQIMAGCIEGLGFSSQLLSNEGPFGVGYAVATCLPKTDVLPANKEDDADPHVALARLSVETFVRTRTHASLPADTPRELLERRAAVFVSLHKQGELRGCIGTLSPQAESVGAEILRNGVLACSEDPRFAPVSPEELDYLEYSVDVLSAPERIPSTDELDPSRYGVIVTQGWKRGVLLPNLEGVDSIALQVAIAKQKAGIDTADEHVELERFEVVRHTRGGEPRKG